MRTETKTVKIYNFDELSEEIKQKLIEKNIKEQQNCYYEYYLEEDMKETAKRLLQKYFKNNNAELNQVYYDLNYCQGDGAMFTFYLNYYGENIQIYHRGNYCHAYSFEIIAFELTGKRYKKLKEKIATMFEEFTKIGYKLAEYKISEAVAVEFLKVNKYLENGEIYQ